MPSTNESVKTGILKLLIDGVNDGERYELAKNFEETCLLFEVPPECPAVLNVADNLKILMTEHRQAFDAGLGDRIPTILTIIEKIIDNATAIKTIDDDAFIPFENTLARLDNFYGTNPLYTAIYHGTSSAATAHRYRLLQAHAIVAYIRIAPRIAGEDPQQLIEFTRAVRALGERQYEKTIASLPSDQYDIKEYARAVESSVNPYTPATKKYKRFRSVLKRIADVLRGRVAHTKRRSKTSRKTSISVGEYFPGRGERPLPEFSQLLQQHPELGIRLREETDGFQSSGARCKQLGIDPNDALKTRQVLCPSARDKTEFYSIREYVLSMRRREAPLAQSNNSLPWSVSTPFEPVLPAVIDSLTDSSTHSDSDPPTGPLATALTLVTSRKLVTWAQLQVVESDIDVNWEKISAPVILLSWAALVLPTEFALHERVCPRAWNAHRRIPEKYIVLAVPDFIVLLARKHRELSSGESQVSFDLIIQRYLHELSRRVGRNLKAKDLENFLVNRFREHPIYDTTDATFIAGEEIEPRTSATSYAGIGLQYIASMHAQLLDEVSRTCDIPQLRLDPANVHRLLDDIGVSEKTPGSRITPTLDALAAGVTSLIEDIKTLSPPRSINQLAHRHNLFVLYVTRLICYCTAYRAVAHPFPAFDEIDREGGLTVISDKDADGFPDSRLVWLAKVALEQITEYSNYLAGLATRLASVNPSLAQHVAALHRRALVPATRKSWKKQRRTEFSPFFFLSSDAETIEPVTLEALGKLAAKYFPLPLNQHRHALETYLRERETSRWVINYFLGHWVFGTQPHEKHSTFSPLVYKQVLLENLEPVLNSMGWTVLKLS